MSTTDEEHLIWLLEKIRAKTLEAHNLKCPPKHESIYVPISILTLEAVIDRLKRAAMTAEAKK